MIPQGKLEVGANEIRCCSAAVQQFVGLLGLLEFVELIGSI